jgi:hypothetical protein
MAKIWINEKPDLDLRDSAIVSLPPDLKVRGELDLRYTPISKKYTQEQIQQMVPGVKGYNIRL